MSLETVAKYVTAARVLLQDTKDAPYRYPDIDILNALSEAFPEAKKLRPDLFLVTPLQDFAVNDSTAVIMDPMYRQALVYYIVGKMQLRDDEEVQDQRAAAFLSMFQAKLTTVS